MSKKQKIEAPFEEEPEPATVSVQWSDHWDQRENRRMALQHAVELTRDGYAIGGSGALSAKVVNGAKVFEAYLNGES